jgi:hypothetical protein
VKFENGKVMRLWANSREAAISRANQFGFDVVSIRTINPDTAPRLY